MTSGRPFRSSTMMTPKLSYCTGILDAARAHLEKSNAQSDQDDHSIYCSSDTQQPFCTCSKMYDHIRDSVERGRPQWRSEDRHDRLVTPATNWIWDVEALERSLLDVEANGVAADPLHHDKELHKRFLAEDKSPALESDDNQPPGPLTDKHIGVQCFDYKCMDAIEEKNHCHCRCECADKDCCDDHIHDPIDSEASNTESWETQSTDNVSTDSEPIDTISTDAETTSDDSSDTDDSIVVSDDDYWTNGSEGSWGSFASEESFW